MAWRKTLMKTTWMVFAAAFMIYAGGCTTTESARTDGGADNGGIEIMKKGEPAPEDGFWLSRYTFLMLYEAAEKLASTRSSASQHAPRNSTQPSAHASELMIGR